MSILDKYNNRRGQEEVVLTEIQQGRGSAKIVSPFYNDLYIDIIDDLVNYDDIDDYAFLEALTNGGETGAGLAVLTEAVKWCRQHGLILFVLVSSETDQEKLKTWYLETGLFDPTSLSNVLRA